MAEAVAGCFLGYVDCGRACRNMPWSRSLTSWPLTRATFWEVIAIPDIRSQCAALAAHLRVVLASAERLRAPGTVTS